MVDLGNRMKLRQFYDFDQMMTLAPEIEPAHLQELLDEMSVIGILEYDYGDHYNDDGPIADAPRIKRWRLPFFVPGSAELFNSSKDRIDKNPPVANFFERMTFIPLAGITQMVPPGGDGIGMHVIPVEEAVNFQNDGRQARAHLLLAQEVRGTHRCGHLLLPLLSHDAWGGLRRRPR